MTITSINVAIIPPLTHHEAMRLQAHELRDLWMHRVDVTHALGRQVERSADHDGRIIADVVAEWARRHGKPFVLNLTGPAGGSYAHDRDLSGAENITLDAVDFCRTLAGRRHATGLLATVVPF